MMTEQVSQAQTGLSFQPQSTTGITKEIEKLYLEVLCVLRALCGERCFSILVLLKPVRSKI
jgi:hypothetical protein